MARPLVAQQQRVAEIFSNAYAFKIPGYQRPYAWTTEQAQELLDDLVGFMRASAGAGASADLPAYFLGTIVLIKDEARPEAEVIDGQQRLTTLTLLLAALRELVPAKDATEITKLLYEEGSTLLGTQDRYRLVLRDRDADFFRSNVQQVGGIAGLAKSAEVLKDSRLNLRANAKLYLDRIGAMTEMQRLELAQFIVRRCVLVVVSTPDLEAAYRIFSVLNSRGLDLAATDIFKSEVLGGLPQAEREIYTVKWEDAEDDLGRDAFLELFGHIRMIYRKAKPQGTLLKEFKEHVSEYAKPKVFVDSVLLPMVQAFEEISDSSYASTAHAEQINEYLRWLNRLEFKDWVPPALAFMVRHRNDSERVLQFFKDLERLTYGLLIMRKGINDRVDRFSKLTTNINENLDLFSDKSALQLTGYERYLVYEALNGSFYESFQARARSAVLLRLDALLSGGGASYDYDTITVEHVLPQSPKDGSEWHSWFPDPKLRLAWVHRIGNLALLTRKKNSAASNYDFLTKKQAYFQRKDGVSPFVLTTQVLDKTQWTSEILDERQKQLIAIFERHWRLDDRESDPFADLL